MSQILRKVCPLFGYFDNFIRLIVANNLRGSLDMDTVFLWARARVEHILSRCLQNATCPDLMNGHESSHDSPPPPCAGNGGRRRTCLREMCWLKSIEVEDKKIIWRKVSHYFGIYHWNFLLTLHSRLYWLILNIHFIFFIYIFKNV